MREFQLELWTKAQMQALEDREGQQYNSKSSTHQQDLELDPVFETAETDPNRPDAISPGEWAVRTALRALLTSGETPKDWYPIRENWLLFDKVVVEWVVREPLDSATVGERIIDICKEEIRASKIQHIDIKDLPSYPANYKLHLIETADLTLTEDGHLASAMHGAHGALMVIRRQLEGW